MTLPEKLFARIVETDDEEDHYIDAEEALEDLEIDEPQRGRGIPPGEKVQNARRKTEVVEQK